MVRIRRNQRDQRMLPGNALFCARRCWTKHADFGYMKRIEDTFQAIATRLVSGATSISSSEHQEITRFCSLWRLRFFVKQSPLHDGVINGVAPEPPRTLAQQENLESNGYAYAIGNVMPGEQIASFVIQVWVNRLCDLSTSWGVIISKGAEFVVPDTFGALGVVPLSPTCCLVANQASAEISSENVVAINRIAVEQSVQYYFARDFSSTML
jgi:hypothetical protein